MADNPETSRNTMVGWMIYSIIHWDILEIEWTNAIQTRNVDSILVRIRSTLMMRVDAAL